MEFKRGASQISFSPEIDWDHTSPKDWSLNILTIANLSQPDHEHYILREKDIIRLCEYLVRLREHIASLKRKRKVGRSR